MASNVRSCRRSLRLAANRSTEPSTPGQLMRDIQALQLTNERRLRYGPETPLGEFGKFPLEVREMIYENLIPDTLVLPHPSWEARIRALSALVQTSSTIHDEVTTIMYQRKPMAIAAGSGGVRFRLTVGNANLEHCSLRNRLFNMDIRRLQIIVYIDYRDHYIRGGYEVVAKQMRIVRDAVNSAARVRHLEVFFLNPQPYSHYVIHPGCAVVVNLSAICVLEDIRGVDYAYVDDLMPPEYSAPPFLMNDPMGPLRWLKDSQDAIKDRFRRRIMDDGKNARRRERLSVRRLWDLDGALMGLNFPFKLTHDDQILRRHRCRSMPWWYR